jgi:hypothetical protein
MELSRMVMKTAKPTVQHSDLFGQPLDIGDCVVYPRSNSMNVGTVAKLNPKMVGVKGVGNRWADCNKYPQELVKVSGSEVTMYLLKKMSRS